MKLKFETINYFYLILYHIGIAFLLHYFKFLSKPYTVLLIILGILYIIKKKNTNNEALFVSAYLVGSEVFIKMVEGAVFYEIIKYTIIINLIIGMYFKGFSKNSFVYWIFLLLLIPGVILATMNLNLDAKIRSTIAFNISGPVCLGISSIYCYRRNINFNDLNKVILYIGLPVISTLTIMYLVAPDVKVYSFGTSSNVHNSGNWASNQVSTIIGLGLFCFFTRIIFKSKDIYILLLNIVICIVLAFRGIATFSRGGMFTSFTMMIILTIIIYLISNSNIKFNLLKASFIALIMCFLLWNYTSERTNGMIDKRYANQDPNGRVKESKFTGREVLFLEEFELFIQNPYFGIGVAKSREKRLESSGIDAAVHSEISRMLSEHGSLGLIGLLLLIFTPLLLYIDNQKHIYLLCFLIFWILTINHAAMRLAAPAFIYALSLLKISFVNDDQNSLYRK